LNEDKSTRYHRLKRRSAVASLAISTAVLVVLLTSGLSISIADIARRASHTDPLSDSALAVVIYVLIVVALHEVATFPVALYQGFLLERRYGLSKEAPGGWLADHAKDDPSWNEERS